MEATLVFLFHPFDILPHVYDAVTVHVVMSVYQF